MDVGDDSVETTVGYTKDGCIDGTEGFDDLDKKFLVVVSTCGGWRLGRY